MLPSNIIIPISVFMTSYIKIFWLRSFETSFWWPVMKQVKSILTLCQALRLCLIKTPFVNVVIQLYIYFLLRYGWLHFRCVKMWHKVAENQLSDVMQSYFCYSLIIYYLINLLLLHVFKFLVIFKMILQKYLINKL